MTRGVDVLGEARGLALRLAEAADRIEAALEGDDVAPEGLPELVPRLRELAVAAELALALAEAYPARLPGRTNRGNWPCLKRETKS
jgi:hypothetical protein